MCLANYSVKLALSQFKLELTYLLFHGWHIFGTLPKSFFFSLPTFRDFRAALFFFFFFSKGEPYLVQERAFPITRAIPRNSWGSGDENKPPRRGTEARSARFFFRGERDFSRANLYTSPEIIRTLFWGDFMRKLEECFFKFVSRVVNASSFLIPTLDFTSLSRPRYLFELLLRAQLTDLTNLFGLTKKELPFFVVIMFATLWAQMTSN